MKKIKILSILLASSLTLGSGLLPSYSPLMAAEKDQTQVRPIPKRICPSDSFRRSRKEEPYPKIYLKIIIRHGEMR